MDIQDVLTCARPPDAGSGQRGPGVTGVRCEGVRDGNTDRCIVSSKAIAIYEVERAHKFDVVRDRVRLGYYLQNGVLDRVVGAMADEMSREHVAEATF